MREVRLDPDPGIVREGAASHTSNESSRRDTPSLHSKWVLTFSEGGRVSGYAKAFFNRCVVEEIIDASPPATIKKPAKENERDRRHSIQELREIWVAASSLG